MLRMRLSRRCVGVDDHIDPAGCTDFTEIQCEFDGTQRVDVGIDPYAEEGASRKHQPLQKKIKVLRTL